MGYLEGSSVGMQDLGFRAEGFDLPTKLLDIFVFGGRRVEVSSITTANPTRH